MQQTAQENWWDSTLGRYVLALEQQKYDTVVGDVFGFNAVQIGLPQVNLLQNSRISKRFLADVECGDLHCESDYLPLAESCIDLLCLPHTLEFSQNPHQTLREAARVLVAEGHLLMTGFNPFSAWGVKQLLTKSIDYPWCGQFFGLPRIRDWLTLLGLEIVEVRFCVYALPIKNEKWHKRLCFTDKMGEKWWPMLGGSYFIVAKKRVANMTLLRPSWKKNPLKSKLAVTVPPKKTKPSQRISGKHE